MPLLTYSLSNRRSAFHASQTSRERKIWFDGTLCSHNCNEFEIRMRDAVVDGALAPFHVEVSENGKFGVPALGNKESDLWSFGAPDRLALVRFSPAWTHSEFGAHDAKIVAFVNVPREVFDMLLHSDMSTAVITFNLRSKLSDENFKYGWRPDGSDVVWTIGSDEATHFYAESFEFGFEPRGNDETALDVTATSHAQDPSTRTAPTEIVVNTEPLSAQVNRVFWLLLIVSALLLLKLYL